VPEILLLKVKLLTYLGNCSSSYSLAAVGAINDRLCLQNKKEHVILSAQTPVACDKSINNQCKGGYVSRTLDYAKIYGLV
jgi:cathepsin B